MNTWEQIKKTIEYQGDKSIIVIEDNISYLIKKLNLDQKKSEEKFSDNTESEEINKDIEEWNNYKTDTDYNFKEEIEGSDVKIEDLPF